MFTTVDKFLTAIIAPLILYLVQSTGVTPEMPFGEAINALLVAVSVYFVPNKA